MLTLLSYNCAMKFVVLALVAFFISFSSVDAYEVCDETYLCLENSEAEVERKAFSDNNEDNELLFYTTASCFFEKSVFTREEFRCNTLREEFLLKPPPNISIT